MLPSNYIWNDRGSGADKDVAIWSHSDYENGFGDTAEASHNRPTSFSATVHPLTPDALAPPVSYIEVWRERGSGADHLNCYRYQLFIHIDV